MGLHRVGHDLSDLAVAVAYLNGVEVFSTFFNLRQNLAISSSKYEPQSALGLSFFSDCIVLLYLWLQRLQSI